VLVIAFKMGLTLERKHGRGRDLARGAEKNIAGLQANREELDLLLPMRDVTKRMRTR